MADTRYLWNEHLPVNTFPSLFHKYLLTIYVQGTVNIPKALSLASGFPLYFSPWIQLPSKSFILALVYTSPILPSSGFAAHSTGMNWNCLFCSLPHWSPS